MILHRLTGLSLYSRPILTTPSPRSRRFSADGFKFDLRLYVLVTCCDPLRLHLYDEGLLRLCTEPYREPCPSNATHLTMHLTNTAINKHSHTYHVQTMPETKVGSLIIYTHMYQLHVGFGMTTTPTRSTSA